MSFEKCVLAGAHYREFTSRTSERSQLSACTGESVYEGAHGVGHHERVRGGVQSESAF